MAPVISNSVSIAVYLAVSAAILSGCAHSDRAEKSFDQEQRLSASPPAFLAGPAGVLLTNLPGFRAHAAVVVSTFSGQAQTLGGELQGLGSQLVFTPQRSGVYFIWNVSENGGYILNQPLQGYSPISSTVAVTNLTAGTEMAGAPAEKINGHPCKRADVILALSAGPPAQFAVWRAIDLNGFPIRLKSLNGASRFTLELSKVRLEPPPRDIFLPPDGFTKYANPELMMTELLTRKATLKRHREIGPMNDQMPEGSRGRRSSQFDH